MFRLVMLFAERLQVFQIVRAAQIQRLDVMNVEAANLIAFLAGVVIAL
jgi:hypothetical protein